MIYKLQISCGVNEKDKMTQLSKPIIIETVTDFSKLKEEINAVAEFFSKRLNITLEFLLSYYIDKEE